MRLGFRARSAISPPGGGLVLAEPPAGRSSRAASGLVQSFGLDPRAAMLAVVVDTLVFEATLGSLGALYVVEVAAGVALAVITYRMQRAWYGDDHDTALIKALTIGLLTAIPAPITPLIAGPGGLLGLARLFRRKK